MSRIVLTAAAFGFLVVCSQPAAAQDPKPVGDCTQRVVVDFPTAGPSQTQWDVCYQVVPKYGLVVTGASFRPSPLSPHVRLLSDARIAEIFVPYSTGKPRFFDIKGANYDLRLLTTKDCPASAGTLVALSFVCQEIRDRGLAWKLADNVRRGEQLVLWGALQAGNYVYLIEWTFLDNGGFRARVGSTGPTRKKTPTEGHMHDFTWRLDIDLNGADGDTVHWTRHRESVETETDPGTSATDDKTLVPAETSLDWTPGEFTTLELTDATLQNANGRKTAYDLVPLRLGTAVHPEAFIKDDFWITRYKPTELLAVNLPSYVGGETVDGQDIVVWYTGSACHEQDMRDEDKGSVPVRWVGFTLEPKNLFNRTPVFP